MKKNSRKDFLKAGLLVGGALYADPAAALAGRGGVEPAVGLYPKNTKISKFVPGLYDGAGDLTLGMLSSMALLNEKMAAKLGPRFGKVTYNDMGDMIAYVVQQMGGNTPVFSQQSGAWKISCSCCTCCCYTA